jgi:hypothetical protein
MKCSMCLDINMFGHECAALQLMPVLKTRCEFHSRLNSLCYASIYQLSQTLLYATHIGFLTSLAHTSISALGKGKVRAWMCSINSNWFWSLIPPFPKHFPSCNRHPLVPIFVLSVSVVCFNVNQQLRM